MNDLSKSTDLIIRQVWEYTPHVLMALLILVIGLWIIGIVTRSLRTLMGRRKVDASLASFLGSLINIMLKAILVISVISTAGINVASFIAVLGAAGLAIGLALQGTLQNFAGGVMVLAFKPFKVGDYIDVVNHSGTVQSIEIFNTHLKTPDNKTIIIPNGQLANTSMVNFSKEPTRRVDWTFGVGYGDDPKLVRKTLTELINNDARILKDPEPFIAVSELADSSVNFVVRVWANSADYWGVFFDMNENAYNKFTEAGINIPYPQMDVHVTKPINP